MPYSFKTAEIVGDVKGKYWSQALQKDGLLVVIEISPNSDNPASQAKPIFDEILLKIEENPINSLSTLQKILSFFQSNETILTLTIGKILNNVLYIGNIGEGSVLIKRGKKVIKLVGGGENVSGFIKKGDLLFISSRNFNNLIQPEKQKTILETNSFGEIPEILAPQILTQPDSSGAAALILNIIETDETPLPTSPEQDQTYEKQFQNKKLSFQHKVLPFIKRVNIFATEEVTTNDKEIKSKKTLATVAFILIILLCISIFLGIKGSTNKTKTADFAKTIDLISHQYDEAGNLIGLNPARARTLLSDAQKSLVGLEKSFDKNSGEFQTIQKWIAKIKDEESIASKIYKIDTLSPFYDLSLLKSTGAGTALALYQNRMVLLDTKNKVAYSLTTDTKKGDIIAGADTIKDARLISVHGQDAYILNNKGIQSINIESHIANTIIKTDSQWGDIGALVAFAGNIYLLDKSHNQIWKYIATENGFTQIATYLNSDIKPDFSRVGSMAIDGSVWVLSGNDIVKFTQGRADTFQIQGIVNPIMNASSIFTNDNTTYLYLWDKAAGQIVVLGKDGTYQSAYEWTGLKSASGFIVSEKDKKIFILSASKIYAIDLK